jgi:DNA-binding transcriptional MerR regulator
MPKNTTLATGLTIEKIRDIYDSKSKMEYELLNERYYSALLKRIDVLENEILKMKQESNSDNDDIDLTHLTRGWHRFTQEDYDR